MAELTDLDTQAGNNNAPPPNGFPENMQYSAVNNSARELQAQIARLLQAGEGMTTTGTGNAYVLTIDMTVTPTAPETSVYPQQVLFAFTADRTSVAGAVTLSINGEAATAIVDNASGTALDIGDIVADSVYLVKYDGTQFRLINTVNVIAPLKNNGVDVFRTQQHDAEGNTSGAQAIDHSGTFNDVGFNVVRTFTNQGETINANHMGHRFRPNNTNNVSTYILNDSADVPIGARVEIWVSAAGGAELTTASGTTLIWFTGSSVQTGNRTLSQGATVVLHKNAAAFWDVAGQGIS